MRLSCSACPYPVDRTTTCRSLRSVLMSGRPTPSSSSGPSRSIESRTLAANDARCTLAPSDADVIASVTSGSVCRVPSATLSWPWYTSVPSTRTRSPSRMPSTSAPSASIRGMPASRITFAPPAGKRPEIDGAALRIAPGRADARASAVRWSRSIWSMIAISPRLSRRASRIGLVSSLATPEMKRAASSLTRPVPTIRFMAFILPCLLRDSRAFGESGGYADAFAATASRASEACGSGAARSLRDRGAPAPRSRRRATRPRGRGGA